MIAIDYDGVVADTNALKVQWIQEHLGIDVPNYLCDRTSCVPLIGKDNYEIMGSQVYESSASADAPLVEGAADALKTLASNGPLYLLSARTDQRLLYARTWLERHGLADLFEALVPAPKQPKLDVASELGCKVLVDDDARHLSPARASVGGILLKVGLTGGLRVPAGIEVASSWDDALAVILDRIQAT